MYFSAKTVAIIAASGMLAATEVSAGPIAERSTTTQSLCSKPNYGASGYPWQSSSTPGSFCSKSKPGNSPAWQAIPYADGYDTVKCATWSWSWSSWSWVKGGGIDVCYNGNKAQSVPWGLNLPHKIGSSTVYLWGLGCGGKTSTTTKSNTATSSVTSSSVSSSAVAVTTTSAAQSYSAAAVTTSSSSASNAASSMVVFSSVGGNVVSSVVAGASSAGSVASSAISVPSSAAAVVTSAASSAASAVSSAAAAATTTVAVDPSTAPLCEADFQVQYLNYTVVAPNGVWTGLTVGAAAQDASYMTYTLATSIDDCLAACDQIEGCVFVNTYYDENDTETNLPKHTPGVLTCAMFSSCVPTSENNNWGGQDDPNVIVDSNGYCKSAACGASS